MFRRLALVLEAIKFSHSVFALPFALTAMLLASRNWPEAGRRWPPGRTVLWIIAAAVAARTCAMAFNRWADAALDARNPRTRERAIPAGRLSPGFMLGFCLAAAGVFFAAAGMLNGLCLALAAPCLAALLGYSYSKRFTAASHLWLGAALGMAPAGAWIAVRGQFGAPPIALGAAVVFWVAGFDIIYACQDVEVDLREGLHSIPSRWGVRRALWISAAFHALAWAGFAAMLASAPLGFFYGAAVAAAGLLLIWQHWIVRPNDLSRVNAAFFLANGMISMALLLGALADCALAKS